MVASSAVVIINNAHADESGVVAAVGLIVFLLVGCIILVSCMASWWNRK